MEENRKQRYSLLPKHTGHDRLKKIWGFPDSLVLFLYAVLDHVLSPSKPPCPLPIAHLTNPFRAKAGGMVDKIYLALHHGV